MQLIYEAAGAPPYESTASGRCRVCGRCATGVLFTSWVRDTFNDHDKLMRGEILCQACQFSFDESSALLAKRAGKEKPQRMRNYSHFVINGEWIPYG
jgi:hypothetical protein